MAKTSSAKVALSTVLGSITSAANSVSSIFDTANNGIGMLNRAVATAAEKQAISTDYDLASYEDNLLNGVAIEQARANREIRKFFDEDAKNEDMFKAAYTSLQEAVAARRAKRQS